MQVLKKNLNKLYRDWKDGSHIFLKLGKMTWKVFIEWVGESCTLAMGWSEFADGANLTVGDILVFYNQPSSNINMLNVCVHNRIESPDMNSEGKCICHPFLFYFL